MSRITSSLVAAALLGQLVGLLGWIDPLFFPLAVAAPLVTGAVAAAQGIRPQWVAVLWASAGLCMLWTDWVVNREDAAFHLVVTVFMTVLALAGWGAVALATRSRRTTADRA